MLLLFSALCLSAVAESWTCTLCQQLVLKVEEMITTQAVESEIIAACEALCQQMQLPYSTLCTSVVGQYVPIICEWVRQGLETSNICAKLGFCEALSAGRARFQPRKANDVCSTCQTAVNFIEEALKSTTVVEEIIAMCDTLCEKQQIISDICKYIVKTYVPVIIKWLEQGIESLDICTKIGFCSTQRPRIAPRKAGNSVICDMCSKTVAYIRQLHEAGQSIQTITQMVEAICNSFPSPLSNTCHDVIGDYVTLIIHMIDDGSSDADVCSKIGLCFEEKFKRGGKKFGASQVSCTMCQTVVLLIEKLIDGKTVESEIEAQVATYCESLSSPLSTICVSLIEHFVPIIIEWVEQGIEALNICVNLGLCDADVIPRGRPVVRKN